MEYASGEELLACLRAPGRGRHERSLVRCQARSTPKTDNAQRRRVEEAPIVRETLPPPIPVPTRYEVNIQVHDPRSRTDCRYTIEAMDSVDALMKAVAKAVNELNLRLQNRITVDVVPSVYV
jgi:hypothetical protein